MQVYALARWRNEQSSVIPSRILHKAPSAELRPNQKDEDSLPPYPQLDAILRALIDEEQSVEDVRVAPVEVVREVAALVRRAEYKRRQAPPGVKVTQRHFGRGRRYPITNSLYRVNHGCGSFRTFAYGLFAHREHLHRSL